MTNKKQKQKQEKVIELKISPSRAYLATQCLEWQNIKSGTALLKKGNSQNTGIEKHEEIENDISIVKNFLPMGWEEMEVLQEQEVETEISYKGFLMKVRGFVDAFIFDKSSNTLYVFDWKTGGSQVETLSDDQLVLYAYAIDKGKNIELIYVNPDLNTSFTKKYTSEGLKEKAFSILEKIAQRYKDKSYNVGGHCQYCPAKSACPELLKQLYLLITPEVNGKPIELFTEKQLDLVKVGEPVITELKNRMKAFLALNPDKNLHGYILAFRAGKREISVKADLKEFSEKLGLSSTEELFEKKLLSVKELENKGLNIDLVSDFIFQPTSKILQKQKI
jgi:hypothetical protein